MENSIKRIFLLLKPSLRYFHRNLNYNEKYSTSKLYYLFVKDNTNKQDHYKDKPSNYRKQYGYNDTPIPYPFWKDETNKEIWQRRLRGEYDFPPKLKPIYDATKRCGCKENDLGPTMHI